MKNENNININRNPWDFIELTREEASKTIHIRLNNRFGAAIERCPKHIDKVRQYFSCVTSEYEINATCECEDCRTERMHREGPAKMKAVLLSGRLSHTRFRSWCRVGAIYAYVRDNDSPTGVMLAATLEEGEYNKLVDELKTEGKANNSSMSPLSPTEGL
jgi:hypothetical protein